MANFDNYLFHCSSIGKIMTNPRSGPGLSETCKEHLLSIWIEQTWGRRKDFQNKYIEKGNMVEEDSLTLYSRATKTFYKKNQETFKNEFLIGTPDIIHNGSIKDIKSSWSIHTFYDNFHEGINKGYDYQINGYMAIVPDITEGALVYCLVNTPHVLIEQEKSKLRYKLGVIDADISPEYLEACEQIDKNSIFDDIPIDKRYIEFEISKRDMQPVYTRVKECRNFLNSLS